MYIYVNNKINNTVPNTHPSVSFDFYPLFKSHKKSTVSASMFNF